MSRSIQINLCGGLGNQLFQILVMLEISKRDNIPYYISNESKTSPSVFEPRNTYWDTVFKKLKFTPLSEIPNPEKKIKEHDSDIFITIEPITCHVILEGYFQCSKYFTKETFQEFISLTPETPLIDLYPHVTGRKIFLHVRRGDYLKLDHFHITMKPTWYALAINLTFSPEDDTFFIFSDDLDWCENNFSWIPKKVFVKNQEDYTDMMLMGECDGGIISASSFSWFGAFLVRLKNPSARIVAPNIWFKNYKDQIGFRNESDWIINPVFYV